jgi:PD-(D/E)XK nuclease superfamily
MIRLEKIADFISEYRGFHDNLFLDFKTDFNRLAKDYCVIKDEWRQYNKKEAESFNIFKILGLTHYEVSTHSSFLRELLDSDGSHGQGNLFFNKFLVMLAGKNVIEKDDIAYYTNRRYDDYLCVAEHVIDTGRIDIIVSRPNKINPFYIIIENKIYAADQESQIERYWQWLDKIEIPLTRKKILYLTLQGKKPEKESINVEQRENLEKIGILHYISYEKDIKKWLQELNNVIESNKVKYTINQYLDTIDILQ